MNNKAKVKESTTKNTVLGFIFIILLFAVSIVVIVFLGKYLFALLKNLSKIDAVIIVALITGAISLVVTIISKVIDYKNSRKQYLAQKREKPYEEFINMVYKVQRNTKIPDSYTEEEMIKDYKAFSEALTLWGSKNVAEKWVKFRLNNNNVSAEEMMYTLEDILNEMRSDMGVKKLNKGTLLSFFINDLDK